MSEYFPEVAWRTIVDNVTVTATPYYYTVDVFPLDSNEPGADPLDIAIGYWLIDNGGYTYLITNVFGSTITVYDINERSWGDSYIGPLEDLPGYVYKTKNGAFLLSQAQLRFLDKSAPDILYPIEKGIIWKSRGIEINALYGDGEAVETIAEDSIDNITKLSLSPEFILRTEEDGWQGGKKYSLSLDGLLHNTLQDIQGTGLGDDYIHLDQDQVDALWTKDGLNITRDSAASLTGILSVDEIKSYTSDLPLIKKDGNNVRISTCILSDCVNDRVGIFTETPLDHLHLTGYARISTLAETANSSLVTSNADGRLIKLPYDNNESKYLRSDGTWAVVLTSTGDFLDSVIRMIVDSTFDPGIPSNGDRYIILNAASIHANFGTINKFSDGSALTLGNNDIVQYYPTHSEFRIVYDSSAAMQPATVTVGTDTNGNTNHQWTYNVTNNMWVDRGAATNHNSLDGLNDGDYKHLTAVQYTNFISLTDGSDVSNTLHNHNTQYAIKQSSTTDTTSGRGLIVGAFGLGGTNVLLDNFNDIVVSGLYRFSNTTPDRLFDYGTILNMRYGSGNISQLIFPVTAAGDLMFRRYQTTWRDAYTIYHTGNLVNPVTGIGSAGRVAFWNSATGLTKDDDFLFDSGTLSFANGTGGREVNISNAGIRFKVSETGGWAMALTARDQSNSILGNIVGGYGGENSFTYAYLGGGTTYNNAALYAHSNNSVSINKTSVTSGYKLDVNGASVMTGLKVGTLSGLTRMNGGVMEAASIIISTSEPSTSGRLNGDIWIES